MEESMNQDMKRALLGDHEASKRLSEAGVLLACPFCGETTICEGSLRGEVWYFCGKDECASIGATSENEYGARLAWNTRAPVLSAEELQRLEENT